jgi:hypothetical protein
LLLPLLTLAMIALLIGPAIRLPIDLWRLLLRPRFRRRRPPP